MTDAKAIVEIRDGAGKWFTDCESPRPVSPEVADARVAELRGEGFTARARLADAP